MKYKMINKVLVAVDESEKSRKALLFSANLVSSTSSELIILTVEPPVSSTQLGPRGSGQGQGAGAGIGRSQRFSERYDAVEEELDEKHKVILSDSLELVKTSYPNINVSSLLSKGLVSKIIVNVAEEKNVDLIVMGCGGKKGLKKLLLGSVSKQVLDDTSKSVLIVK